jgi:hypothetical protein
LTPKTTAIIIINIIIINIIMPPTNTSESFIPPSKDDDEPKREKSSHQTLQNMIVSTLTEAQQAQPKTSTWGDRPSNVSDLKRVWFNTVEIMYHDIILGDNPGKIGCPRLQLYGCLCTALSTIVTTI